MLKDPNCADFIKELLNRTAEIMGPKNSLVAGGNIVGIYNKVLSQNGVVRIPNNGASYAPGFIAEGTAQIQIAQHFGTYHPVAAANIRRGDAHTVLNESLHHAGERKYYDYNLSVALSQMPGMKPLPTGTGDPYGKDRFLYSSYMHAEVNKRCK